MVAFSLIVNAHNSVSTLRQGQVCSSVGCLVRVCFGAAHELPGDLRWAHAQRAHAAFE